MTKTTRTISPKVVGGTVAAAASVIIVWLLSVVGVDVPEAVEGAFTVILTFVGGWLLPDPLRSRAEAD